MEMESTTHGKLGFYRNRHRIFFLLHSFLTIVIIVCLISNTCTYNKYVAVILTLTCSLILNILFFISNPVNEVNIYHYIYCQSILSKKKK